MGTGISCSGFTADLCRFRQRKYFYVFTTVSAQFFFFPICLFFFLQVIIDSQPLTVALLASVLFEESIGLIGAAGLALGVFGLLLLEVICFLFLMDNKFSTISRIVLILLSHYFPFRG